MTNKLKSLAWFKARVGKRIYRDEHKCCSSCEESFKNGFIVLDLCHAKYLHAIQNDFTAEGVHLNYRDNK